MTTHKVFPVGTRVTWAYHKAPRHEMQVGTIVAHTAEEAMAVRWDHAIDDPPKRYTVEIRPLREEEES